MSEPKAYMQNINITSLRAAVRCGEAIPTAIWEIASGKTPSQRRERIYTLELRQNNGLLFLVFAFFISVRDFTLFVCFKEQDLR